MKLMYKITVKLGWSDLSMDVVYSLMSVINDYLPKQNQLYQPEIDGSYLTFSVTNTIDGVSCPIEYISGLVAGYLLANGVEVI